MSLIHRYICIYICLGNGTNVSLLQYTFVNKRKAFTNVAMCAGFECELIFPFFLVFSHFVNRFALDKTN